MKWIDNKHLYETYKEFRKAYRKQHYQNNKDKTNAKGLLYLRNAKRKLVEYMGDKCSHCGNSYPDVVYDFHHLDPKTKEISTNLRSRSFENAVKELQKCIMLCSNCHRIEHAKLNNNL